MESELDWRLEAIELLKQNASISEKDSHNILGDKLEPRLAHKIKIIEVTNRRGGGKRQIRLCQRCKVSWPCLWAQEMAIEKGKQKSA